MLSDETKKMMSNEADLADKKIKEESDGQFDNLYKCTEVSEVSIIQSRQAFPKQALVSTCLLYKSFKPFPNKPWFYVPAV